METALAPTMLVESGVAATAQAAPAATGADPLGALVMPELGAGPQMIPAGKIIFTPDSLNLMNTAVSVGTAVAVALLVIRLFRYAWDLAWGGK